MADGIGPAVFDQNIPNSEDAMMMQLVSQCVSVCPKSLVSRLVQRNATANRIVFSANTSASTSACFRCPTIAQKYASMLQSTTRDFILRDSCAYFERNFATFAPQTSSSDSGCSVTFRGCCLPDQHTHTHTRTEATFAHTPVWVRVVPPVLLWLLTYNVNSKYLK